MQKLAKPFFVLIFILLIVGMACRLPFVPSEVPTTAPVEIATEAELAPQTLEEKQISTEPLPPAVVETDPAPGSVVAPNQRFIFYFNQPVVKKSVESALSSEPGSDLRFEWLDDQTLFVIFAESLPLDQRFTFTLDPGIQAQNGVTSDSSWEFTYQTAGPLLMTDQFPQPEAGPVNPGGTLMVAFNQPVVPLGDATDEPAFTISPAVEGTGKWLNTSTYIFEPEPALGGGIEYTLNLNENLTSLWGSPLMLLEDQASAWTVKTTEPRLLTAIPAPGGEISLEAEFELTFNQSMSPESVIDSLSLQGPNGQPTALEINWNEDYSVFTIQPGERLARSEQYSLILDSTASSYGGTTLAEPISLDYETVGRLAVKEVIPSLQAPLDIYSGYTSLQLQFNAPLALVDFSEMVQFQPALVDPSIHRIDDTTLMVSGYFQGSTKYMLSVSETLQDLWGETMNAPYEVEFFTAPARPQLAVSLLQYGEQVLFMTPGEAALSAQAVNLPGINVRGVDLSLVEFLRLSTAREQLIDYLPNGDSQTWRQLFSTSPEANQDVQIFLSPNRQPLEAGLYAFKLDAPELDFSPPPFLLVVTDIHITTKRSEGQLFVWAVDLANGLPLADANLSLHQSPDSEPASCMTDQDGRCGFDLPRDLEPYHPLVVVYSQPGDEEFGLGVDSWTLGVSGWDFGLETLRVQPEIFSYLYTDRPIYRPGQQVNFRAILRKEENARYFSSGMEQLHIDIYGDFQVETGSLPLLDTIPVSLSAFGSGSGSYLLPEDAPPGSYSLRIREVEESQLNFTVAEYRKPAVDLQISFEREEYLQDENLTAKIQADYFFGAPAANTALQWTLFAQPDFFDLPFGYQTGDQDFSWLEYGYWQPFYNFLGTYVLEGEGFTGPDGAYHLEIPYAQIEQTLASGSIQRLNLEVTIKDESEVPVSARQNIRIHPERYYIGVRPEEWGGTEDSPLGFAVQTADWEKLPVPDVPLTAVFSKVRWIQSADPVSGFQKSTPEYTQVASVDFSTDTNGQARIEFIPEDPGTYLLHLTGGNASTQVLVWVAGSGSVSWPTLPNQQIPITLDQERYAAGQTALLFVPNPFEQALALVTIERDHVMRSFVLEVDQPQLEFPLTIQAEDAPNIYVGVTLIDVENGPDFRQGYVNIPVETDALTLQVDLFTSGEAQPGGEVIFSILISDQDGSPVEGEFSLALVDKAVLALAEPNAEGIVDAFYGTQPLGVQTGLALAAYVGRFPRAAANGIGGGGGAEMAVPVVREEFKDAAFWSGSILTDASGRADILVTLPDNLTTWAASLRGLSMDARVGEAQTEVIVSKELLVRPIVPRFLVVGDEVQFGAVVHNNTPQRLPVDVQLQVSGISLSAQSPEIQRITVEANTSYLVNWLGTVQSIEQVEMVFSAAAGNLSDSTMPENGPIRVLHYNASQTFGTSGMLSDQSDVLELVSLPRSFDVTGGELTVEMAPSLAAAVLQDLETLRDSPDEFTEAILSNLLPNLEMLRATQLFGLGSLTLEADLTQEIRHALDRLKQIQNEDGGWGWMSGVESDDFISSYVLFGLSRASEQGFFIDPTILEKAQDHLLQSLTNPAALENTWQLDRLAFQYFALYSSGITQLDSESLLDNVDRLNPWSRALLHLMRVQQDPEREILANALNDLQSLSEQTATGVYWPEKYSSRENLSTQVLNTAVVLYTIAKLDPASGLLPGGVRYLVSHRQPLGGWSSSYESAWSLMALIEVMKSTGELQSDFGFSASLNGEELISGTTQGVDPITAVVAEAPIEDLFADSPNALHIRKESGIGRLYYRAYLQAEQDVEEINPIQKGLSIERGYALWEVDCAEEDCPLIEGYSLGETDQPVLVKITVTVPEEMFYVVVEDWIPAGTEIVDVELLTSKQGTGFPLTVSDTSLFASPTNWQVHYFGEPQIFDDHIRWVARWLPAGTHQLTYRLTPYLAGAFHTIPARAYQYYFPEVQASSAGGIFEIEP